VPHVITILLQTIYRVNRSFSCVHIKPCPRTCNARGLVTSPGRRALQKGLEALQKNIQTPLLWHPDQRLPSS
ncbi:MAG TPA: hypothetical protein PLA31_03865, partial [Clostridia bacterium]|nr:hypothetical protein [Clostridia bacterium]